MGEPNSLGLVLHRLAIDNRNSEMFDYSFVDGITLQQSAAWPSVEQNLDKLATYKVLDGTLCGT